MGSDEEEMWLFTKKNYKNIDCSNMILHCMHLLNVSPQCSYNESPLLVLDLPDVAHDQKHSIGKELCRLSVDRC